MGGQAWLVTPQMTAMTEGGRMSEAERLRAVAEDMRRCRDELQRINAENRKLWGRR
jgi:hypothetical protein